MAKIDVSTIEGYENMTAEQKLEALLNFEYNTFEGDNAKLKASLDKATSEAAKYKKDLQARLSEEEKKAREDAEEQEKLMAELNGLRRERDISKHKASYIGLGYSEELAQKIAEATLDGKTDEVFAYQKEFMGEYEKNLKAKMMKDTPDPKGGSTPPDFDSMTDAEYYAYQNSKK